jgi:hydrogenase maturation protein HypF
MTTIATSSEDRVRHRIRVSGVVQGVGFRPFVFRLAKGLDLVGHVGNDSEGVFVEIEGSKSRVERFETCLVTESPPLARIHYVQADEVEPCGENGFRIVESRSQGPARTFVSPDIAACDDCLSELWNPSDRRFRYPFINCTNCGPRFTITRELPYDRQNTTMAGFAMCSGCRREYEDPDDRRYHAQPIACTQCGPKIWFEGYPTAGAGAAHLSDADRAVHRAQLSLAHGEIVAIKGIGGYHLACDATCTEAVSELRRRKNRPDKPLAVMVADLAGARRIAEIGTEEARVLTSPERPVVLLRALRTSPLAVPVAPGNPLVGVLLPYSPVHHLLFRSVPGPPTSTPFALVMTSGNLSDEPICYDDHDARERLGGIADAWLMHDRPIHVPCDDSVVRVDFGEELPIRRSRGYAPLPIRLPFESAPMLATGAELKNTFCLVSGSDAWMSQHIGDMGSVETLEAFEVATSQFRDLYEVSPKHLVADAHPGYQVRRWAEDQSWAEDQGRGSVTFVQHHHAHIASAMVEHSVSEDEQVIGFAFDGTGYGTDGAIWGGEVLVGGYGGFERAAHLKYVPLPGGDATIRKPYRSALAHLRAAGIEWSDDMFPVQFAPVAELEVVSRQLERGFQCHPTSSMGRLFDAVSSLLGVRQIVSYEAQAAIELELVATAHSGSAPHYEFAIADDELDQTSVLKSIVSDMRTGVPIPCIAAGFHHAVARLTGECAGRIYEQTGIRSVVLSGGVFQNLLLVRLARAEIERRGLQALTHRLVPPNDGGLALGQAALAWGARSVSGAGR